MLTAHYTAAHDVLDPHRVPKPPREDQRWLAAAAVATNAMSPGTDIRAELTITFSEKTSAGGVDQKGCTGCGDCVTGCNVGAKNTVLMNYLPLADQAGAEIYTEVEVRTVHRHGSRWLVAYRPRGGAADSFSGPIRFVTADAVVLSAGTLGTTEILLRSAAAGLQLSDQLGHRFTGNGDVLAFGYNERDRVNGVGVASDAPRVNEPPGPCISGLVTVDDGKARDREVVVEDAVVPARSPASCAAGSRSRRSSTGERSETASRRSGRRCCSGCSAVRIGGRRTVRRRISS